MKQKSILLCHILIVGIIITNSSPSSLITTSKSENTLPQMGNGTVPDKANIGNSCPQLPESASASSRDDTKIPERRSSHTKDIDNNTSEFGGSYLNKFTKAESTKLFMKKLRNYSEELSNSSSSEGEYEADRNESNIKDQSGSRESIETVESQKGDQTASTEGSLQTGLPRIAVTRINKQRRELNPVAGLKSGGMKRGGSLSTEQSITMIHLSDNGISSSGNSPNDTVYSKETPANVAMNRLGTNASKFFNINQNEKEVTSDATYPLRATLHQTTTVDSLNTGGVTKYSTDSRKVPGISMEGESQKVVRTTEFGLQLPRDHTSGFLTNISFSLSSDVTTPLADTADESLLSPQDPTEHPDRLQDPKYGKVKYASKVKTTSNLIGSLKSHLEKNHGILDTIQQPHLTTSASHVVQSFTADFYSTFITPESMYLANDSAASLNKSASKVFQDIPWPVKKEAVMEGDVIIGGLMMVHEREDTVTCGPIMPQGGIQALEAMLYTLDQINFISNQFLPNITLGSHILDDCDKDTYGLEMAVDFIKGDAENNYSTDNVLRLALHYFGIYIGVATSFIDTNYQTLTSFVVIMHSPECHR